MTVQEADETLKQLLEKRKELEAKEQEVKKIAKEEEELMHKMQTFLVESKRDSYVLKGTGMVYSATKMSVQTPKTIEDKKAFFNWLAREEGQDVSDSYMSVNSQSLNVLYAEKLKAYSEQGKVLQIDGIGLPVSYTQFKFKRS